jgi:hypothetical protein
LVELIIKQNQLENLKKQKEAEDSAILNQIGVRFFNKQPASANTQKEIAKVEKEIIVLNSEIANLTTLADKAEEMFVGAKKFFTNAINFFDLRSEEAKHEENQRTNHLEALKHEEQREELRKQIALLRRT